MEERAHSGDVLFSSSLPALAAGREPEQTSSPEEPRTPASPLWKPLPLLCLMLLLMLLRSKHHHKGDFAYEATLTCLLCVLLLTTLCIPTHAAESPLIDQTRTGSLTIYKYDLISAADDGLTDSVYLSTGQPDADAAADFAPYAIPGAEFTILRVGAIDTYASGSSVGQAIQVVYGIDSHDLISALGLTSGDVVTSKAGVPYYASDTLIKALSDKITENNTSTKDRLERIISNEAGARALPLTDSTGRTGASNLELGLYLAVETKVPANVTYTVDPFLVSIPTTDYTPGDICSLQGKLLHLFYLCLFGLLGLGLILYPREMQNISPRKRPP